MSRDEVKVSELESDVDEPRRRWPNLRSLRALVRADFFRLRLMVKTAQQERSGKTKTKMWMIKQ
jgi:predicted NACHT family NTPase